MHDPSASETSRVGLSIRVGVLVWLCSAATIAYICRTSLGVAESTIRADLQLTEKTMGAVMALFFLSYALGQIPSGWFGHRFGSRRSISLFAIGWSLTTAAIGLASGAVTLIAARMIDGLFQAGLFPCETATISKWYGTHWRAVASGALGSFMSLGGAVGVFATGLLVTAIGWRWTFAAYGSLGIFWAAGFYLWFRDTPEQFLKSRQKIPPKQREPASRSLLDVTDSSPEGDAFQRPAPTPWLALYSSPATWMICGQQFCRAAGQIFFSSWFATYLQETRQVTVTQSGMLNSLPLIALVLGGLTGGATSDGLLAWTGSRRIARSGLASVCMLTCALLVLVASRIDDPLPAVLIISAGTFFAAVGGPCAYTITIDMGGAHVAPLFGTMNMVGNMGAFAFIYGVPWFLDQTGDWSTVLLLFSGLYVGAAMFWILLNPRGEIVKA